MACVGFAYFAGLVYLVCWPKCVPKANPCVKIGLEGCTEGLVVGHLLLAMWHGGTTRGGINLQRPGKNAGILKSGFAGSLAILWVLSTSECELQAKTVPETAQAAFEKACKGLGLSRISKIRLSKIRFCRFHRVFRHV